MRRRRRQNRFLFAFWREKTVSRKDAKAQRELQRIFKRNYLTMKKTIQKTIAAALFLSFFLLSGERVSVSGQTRKTQPKSAAAAADFYNIKTYGARGNGTTRDTSAIN